MKPAPFQARRQVSRTRGGIALIIVLASLVLLAILVAAFLSSVAAENVTSKIYANGASVKLLAQSAVNIVQSEINDATHNPAYCWASQPGMIRVYDTTGTAKGYYKLYSDSPKMIDTTSFDYTANSVPATWYNLGGIYVDLNEPVQAKVNGVNQYQYPIIDGDPNVLATSTSPLDGKATKNYSAAGSAINVAGFWINDTGNSNGATPYNPNAAGGSKVPMPVKWLYVLQDGVVIAPDAALTSGSVTFTSASEKPSKDNPITGRIAFWTDDETCKININTASEGNTATGVSNVWNTPFFNTTYDRGMLGLHQPAQNEFQRYPGHPATVSLSAVFSGFTGDASYPESIFPLTPRTIAGGSTQGTLTATAPLALRADRLYATADEFLLQPSHSAVNSALVNASMLRQAGFFLTASSRAPDLNLFNLPRISMWPVSVNPNSGATIYRSPYDQLIAFCTTLPVGPNVASNLQNIYYFQRQDPNDPYADLPIPGSSTGLGRNRQILEYLRYLTGQPAPGFSSVPTATFASKYNANDTLGSAFSTATERDQILTEMFDYIRSTNTIDQSLAGSGITVSTYTQSFNTIPPNSPGGGTSGGGLGQVVPIVDQNYGTRGFGHFPTLQQAALIYFPVNDDGASPRSATTPPVAATSATQLQAALVLQLADPSMGYPGARPWYRIRITDQANSTTNALPFTWNDGTVMFPQPVLINSPYTAPNFALEPLVGGIVSWYRLFIKGTAAYSFSGTANSGTGFSTAFPATPTPVKTKLTSQTPAVNGIVFNGGIVHVNFYQNLANNTEGALLQSISLTFPPSATSFPLPKLSSVNSAKWSELWNERVNGTSALSYPTVLGDKDVVRAIIANPGDTRLVAARVTIPDSASASFFARHPRWDATTGSVPNMAHALRTAFGNTYYGNSYQGAATPGGGRLVPQAYEQSSTTTPYTGNSEATGMNGLRPSDSDTPNTTPAVRPGGLVGLAGDWDNGIGDLRDGPYINKADEGDNYKGGSGGNVPYFVYDNQLTVQQTFFSPNRMVPSPVMFGSLPSGVLGNKAWQTLLFRPGPMGAGTVNPNHPGLGTPATAYLNTSTYPVSAPYSVLPDYLLLDLFTMPVVEPYAISEPLSTAGRINMNYQIVPFTYITRNTGLQAILKSNTIPSVPNTDAGVYKTYNSINAPTDTHNHRLPIDIANTLIQFQARFAKKDIFRSPAEICSIDLVPGSNGVDPGYTATTPPAYPTRAKMDNYWNNTGTGFGTTLGHQVTGDNSRERPYADIYPLLTTQSNTYTVHYRVQTLNKAKSPGYDATTWTEGTDLITSEYRGSQTIERYLNPNDSTIPDYVANPNVSPATPLSQFYRFRVVSSKQFTP